MSSSPGRPDGGEAQAVAPAPEPEPAPSTRAPDGAAPAAPTGPAPAEAPATGPLGVRASDADRQAMVDWLSKAAGEGLITLEEFATFSGEAYASRTRDELARVATQVQLPPPGPAAPIEVPATPAAAPAATVSAGKRRWVVAVMSGATRKGRWRADRRVGAFAWWGSVLIDLREAELDGGDIEIEAWAFMGSVTVVVPEGIPVETSGFVLMGGRTTRIADVPMPPGAPTVNVAGYGLWGGVTVVSKKKKAERERERAASRAERGRLRDDLRAERDRQREALRAERDEIRRQVRARHGHGHAPPLPEVPSTPAGSGPPGPPPPPPPWPAAAEVPPAPAPTDPIPASMPAPAPASAAPGPSATSTSAPDTGAPPSTPPVTGGLVTIVCTDIVGSTRYADLLGDQRWREVLLDHNDLVRRLLADHGGTEVKTVGDGFLLTFASARSAIRFAAALQDDLAARRDGDADTPLEVRVGVHAGEVEHDGTDVIGRNVTIACRLCDVAAAGEVLVSAVVADLADSASDLRFGEPREHHLAGIERPLTARLATRP